MPPVCVCVCWPVQHTGCKLCVWVCVWERQFRLVRKKIKGSLNKLFKPSAKPHTQMSYSLPIANKSYDIIHCLCMRLHDGIMFWMSCCVSYENKQTYLTGHWICCYLHQGGCVFFCLFVCFYSDFGEICCWSSAMVQNWFDFGADALWINGQVNHLGIRTIKHLFARIH